MSRISSKHGDAQCCGVGRDEGDIVVNIEALKGQWITIEDICLKFSMTRAEAGAAIIMWHNRGYIGNFVPGKGWSVKYNE